MSTTPLHHQIAEHLMALLRAWVATTKRVAFVDGDCFIYPDTLHPEVCFSPDVFLIEADPAIWKKASSYRKSENFPMPTLVVEVVSKYNYWKDYEWAPKRYHDAGVQELWLYNPMRAGGKRAPLLQLYRRKKRATELRLESQGDAPQWSPYLNAWLLPEEKELLRISDDQEGQRKWLTPVELERRQREEEVRARLEAEQAKADAERQREAETRARLEAEQARADAERQREEEMRARVEAERQREAETRARLEAEQAKADAERQREEEMRARVEAQRQREEEARARAALEEEVARLRAELVKRKS